MFILEAPHRAVFAEQNMRDALCSTDTQGTKKRKKQQQQEIARRWNKTKAENDYNAERQGELKKIGFFS